MKIPLISTLLERAKPRILSVDEALAYVAEIGDYLDEVASAPVASIEVAPDRLQEYDLPSLLGEMSPQRKGERLERVKYRGSAAPLHTGFARIHWSGRTSGFDISRRFARLYDNNDLSLDIALPDAIGQVAHELTHYFAEDDGRQVRRGTKVAGHALGARIDAAFSKLIVALSDRRARRIHDPVLHAASSAAQCIAAVIDVERPGLTNVVNAVLDKRLFQTRVFIDDALGIPVTVDGPEHLRDMLPGYPITVASCSDFGHLFAICFAANLVSAPALPQDAVGMTRLVREHGGSVSYGAALDAPFETAKRRSAGG